MDQASLIRAAAMFFGDCIKHVSSDSSYQYEAYAFPTVRTPRPSTTDSVWYVRRKNKSTGAITCPVNGDGDLLFGPHNAANNMSALSYYDPTA